MAISDRKRDSETLPVPTGYVYTGNESLEILINGVIYSITIEQLKHAIAGLPS